MPADAEIALFERFPDRFILAMDIHSFESLQGIADKLAAARTAFAPVRQAIEEE